LSKSNKFYKKNKIIQFFSRKKSFSDVLLIIEVIAKVIQKEFETSASMKLTRQFEHGY